MRFALRLLFVFALLALAILVRPFGSLGDGTVESTQNSSPLFIGRANAAWQFDQHALSEVGLSFVTTGESDGQEPSIELEVEPSSDLEFLRLGNTAEIQTDGCIHTRGAFLIGSNESRIAVVSPAICFLKDEGWVVLDWADPTRVRRQLFTLAPVVQESNTSAGSFRLLADISLSGLSAAGLGLDALDLPVIGRLEVNSELTQDGPVEALPYRKRPSASKTLAGPIGPDVIVGDILGGHRWARVGDITAFSYGSLSCNVGDDLLDWFANTNKHPVISQNMYRLKNDQFEQIGMAWVKHGFEAGLDTFCSGPGGCTRNQTPDRLGVGCSDVYGRFLNGFQSNMGPRSDVNPVSGFFPYPFSAPPFTSAVDRRLQVRDADLDPAQNANALYFVEIQYIMPDDSAAGNQNNNASYEDVLVVESAPDTYSLLLSGTAEQEKPALLAWQDTDPTVELDFVDIFGDGRFILGSKVTDLGNGTWRYEYALQNLNSDRGAQSFSVPIAPATPLSGVSFHDVDSHSGSIYDSTDWDISTPGSALVWSTDDFTINPNANALRWGSLYNFRFDASACPTTGDVSIGLFKSGSPVAVSVQTNIPEPSPILLSSFPPDGAIDGRQPSDPSGLNLDGWSFVDLTFDALPACTPLTTTDFAVTVVGTADPAPSVSSVTPIGGSTVRVALNKSIPLRAWTILTHISSGARVRLGYLPGDVDASLMTNASDITKLVNSLNGIQGPYPIWRTDIDRNGVADAQDITRLIDLLKGHGVYDNYYRVTIPPLP